MLSSIGGAIASEKQASATWDAEFGLLNGTSLTHGRVSPADAEFAFESKPQSEI